MKIKVDGLEISIDGERVATLEDNHKQTTADFKRTVDGLHLFENEFGEEYVSINNQVYGSLSHD